MAKNSFPSLENNSTPEYPKNQNPIIWSILIKKKFPAKWYKTSDFVSYLGTGAV